MLLHEGLSEEGKALLLEFLRCQLSAWRLLQELFDVNFADKWLFWLAVDQGYHSRALHALVGLIRRLGGSGVTFRDQFRFIELNLT